MEEDKKVTEVENIEDNVDKSNNKRFINGYIIFIIILIWITILAIYFTIKRLEEQNPKNEMPDNEISEEASEDTKYVINSYAETYDNNSINIIEYYDVDGTVFTRDSYWARDYDPDTYDSIVIGYLQIEGLKDKRIQSDINQKLRKKSYALKGENTEDVYVSSYVTANFSNILSVYFSGYMGKIDTLNIDLSTGKEIQFEDLFISSTPINLYIYNAAYEALAWQTLYIDEEGDIIHDGDMSKENTSDYEDRLMIILDNYNKQKKNLKYNIYNNSIAIYGLKDKYDVNDNNLQLNIDLLDCIKEVTMYKKYLTKNSIFEDDSIGIKDTIVFTDNNEHENRLNYGKLQDNIFLEEILYESNIYDYDFSIARDYVKKLSEDNKAELIKQSKDKIGVFFQRQYDIWYDNEKGYFNIYVSSYQATCNAEYFKNEAFLDYIKLKTIWGEGDLAGFSEDLKDNFPNLKISPVKREEYYISSTGEFLGASQEEADKKINQQIQEENNEEQQEVDNGNTN